MSDFCVYGALRGIEGLRTFKDIMTNTRIGPWYERMKAVIGPSMAIKVVPETLQNASVPEQEVIEDVDVSAASIEPDR